VCLRWTSILGFWFFNFYIFFLWSIIPKIFAFLEKHYQFIVRRNDKDFLIYILVHASESYSKRFRLNPIQNLFLEITGPRDGLRKKLCQNPPSWYVIEWTYFGEHRLIVIIQGVFCFIVGGEGNSSKGDPPPIFSPG